MVTRWGFSPELGTVAYGENQEEVFLGHSVSRTQNISETTAQKIDNEVRRLVEEGLSEARKILTETTRRTGDPRQGAARIRDAVRRRDQGSDQRQAAGPRRLLRAVDAARIRRAAGRQEPSAAEPDCRPGAAAAGLRSVDAISTRCPACAGHLAFTASMIRSLPVNGERGTVHHASPEPRLTLRRTVSGTCRTRHCSWAIAAGASMTCGNRPGTRRWASKQWICCVLAFKHRHRTGLGRQLHRIVLSR